MTSITDDNFIYRITRKNPKYSAKQIAQEVNLTLKNQISRQTIDRRLRDHKLWCYVAARKILLKPTDRLKRTKFCKAILKMSNYELRRIVFSDESNYTVKKRKNKVIALRHHNQKYSNHPHLVALVQYIVTLLYQGYKVELVQLVLVCITYDGPSYTCYTMVKWTNIDTLTPLKTI